jgi:roadblock/LC7 domain-containing protein
MSELDELVARPSIFMAGRFGADGRVAEHETTGPYIENPPLAGIAQWFCAAVTYAIAVHGDRFLIAERANPEAWTS